MVGHDRKAVYPDSVTRYFLTEQRQEMRALRFIQKYILSTSTSIHHMVPRVWKSIRAFLCIKANLQDNLVKDNRPGMPLFQTAREAFANRKLLLPNRFVFKIKIQTRAIELKRLAKDRKEKKSQRLFIGALYWGSPIRAAQNAIRRRRNQRGGVRGDEERIGGLNNGDFIGYYEFSTKDDAEAYWSSLPLRIMRRRAAAGFLRHEILNIPNR